MKHNVHVTITFLLFVAVVGLVADRYVDSRSQQRPSPSLAIIPFAPTDGVPRSVATFMSKSLYENLELNSSFSLAQESDVVELSGKYAYPEHLGRKLGTSFVLEGAIYRKPDAIWIMAQLIDSESGDHVWYKTYRSSGDDLSRVVANIEADIRQWVER